MCPAREAAGGDLRETLRGSRREAGALLTAKSRAAARDIAARSMVLLKNDGNVLPLARSVCPDESRSSAPSPTIARR